MFYFPRVNTLLIIGLFPDYLDKSYFFPDYF